MFRTSRVPTSDGGFRATMASRLSRLVDAKQSGAFPGAADECVKRSRSEAKLYASVSGPASVQLRCVGAHSAHELNLRESAAFRPRKFAAIRSQLVSRMKSAARARVFDSIARRFSKVCVGSVALCRVPTVETVFRVERPGQRH
jgi:hypothetical protein